MIPVEAADGRIGLRKAEPDGHENHQARHDHRHVPDELLQERLVDNLDPEDEQRRQHARKQNMEHKGRRDQVRRLGVRRHGGIADHLLVDDHAELIGEPRRHDSNHHKEDQAQA
jgi:hypothetical protein